MRYNTESFIKRSIEIYGEGKFDYSEVEYKGWKVKVKLKCLTCGHEFWRTPAQHLKGLKCRYCHNKKISEQNKLTTDEYVRRALKIHGNDKFDYSKTNYIDSNTDIEIVYKRCNTSFWQNPITHLRTKYCCPNCVHELGRKPRLTKEKFIKDSVEIHGDKYSYDKIVVPERGLSNSTKVEIVCNRCGESFWQDYESHVQCGHGCFKCNRGIHTLEDTKGLIKDKFGDNYELIEDSFISFTEPAKFIDNGNKRMIIEISPKDLLRRTGTTCNSSLGEKLVREWLLLNHIIFLERVAIKDLKKKSQPVRIDFVVSYNGKTYWIEYHGQQHFWFVEHLSRTKPNYWKQRIRDQKVRIYCRDNNISLIEIPYIYNTSDSISDLLNEIIIKGKDPKSLINIKDYFK